jgi:hypothetical protein
MEESSPPQHKLLVFHWATFGSNQHGISPTVLPGSDVGRIVTSFEGRNKIHVLSFSFQAKVVTSVVLQVKQKATEFSFRSNQAESHTTTRETINNSLIDCHMEVWTRFPVIPAFNRSILSSLGRQSRKLVFASGGSCLESLDDYFAQMIATFERTTRKPMDGVLTSISIVESSDPPDVLVQRIPCSRYRLGSFVVEFICLIPLQCVKND